LCIQAWEKPADITKLDIGLFPPFCPPPPTFVDIIVFVHFIPFNQLIWSLIFWVLSIITTIYFSIPIWVHGFTKYIIQLKWCNYNIISIWHWYTCRGSWCEESDSYWCASVYIMEECFFRKLHEQNEWEIMQCHCSFTIRVTSW